MAFLDCAAGAVLQRFGTKGLFPVMSGVHSHTCGVEELLTLGLKAREGLTGMRLYITGWAGARAIN